MVKTIHSLCIVANVVCVVTLYLYLTSRHFQLFLISLPLVVGLHTYDINKMSTPAMSCWLELIFAFTTFGATVVDGTTLKRLGLSNFCVLILWNKGNTHK